ncbi:MAG: polyphenol oxidase family protein [Planctomycetes bacterium]|nr:polyphenol oxidase family protein [Planctomycetota bacterium]
MRWRAAGVELAFSTAADGDQRDEALRAAWLGRAGCPPGCLVPVQVHGIRIADPAAGDPLDGADGLVAPRPGPPLGVFGADCPGLALIAPDALGLAHCGWRGTAAGIVPALVAALARRSRHSPAQWTAFIGPGISGARYEVDAPVLTARAWPAPALAPGAPGRAWLDLPAAIAHDCSAAGLTRIERCGVCTAGDPRLRSRRRDGAGMVGMLAAWAG